MFCSVLSWSSKARGAGFSGILGSLGIWRAAVCRVGGSGGLFLKPNDPNLSGGEQFCFLMLCYAMLCSVALCSVMRCSVVLCSVMPCCAMLCHAMFCHALFCHALLRSVLFVEGEGGTPGSLGRLGIWRPRYAGLAGREVCV